MMKRRLALGLAAGALTVGLLPGMAAAAGPSVVVAGWCDGNSLDHQGGPELIRSFRESLRSGQFDACASGYVNLTVNDNYIYGVFFGVG